MATESDGGGLKDPSATSVHPFERHAGNDYSRCQPGMRAKFSGLRCGGFGVRGAGSRYLPLAALSADKFIADRLAKNSAISTTVETGR